MNRMIVDFSTLRKKSPHKRNSSFELLRIISMVLVLVVHLDFLAIGNPTKDELITGFLPCMMRISFEGLAICCVNVFVLISGWFGIRVSSKGFLNFIYQCLFLSAFVISCNLIFGIGDSVKPVAFRDLINLNWFVTSYIGLYIISPILNAFINTSDKTVIRTTLLTLFAFEFLFGFITQWTQDFNLGYSILHFVLLYLLARYSNLHKPWFAKLPKSILISIYFVSALVMTLAGYIIVSCNISNIPDIFNYYNPVVIIESLSLILLFSKITLDSNIINNIAKSCFAVFLLHTHPYVSKAYLYPFVKESYNFSPGLYTLGLCVLIIASVFVASILIDKVRIFTWNVLSKYISIEKYENRENKLR